MRIASCLDGERLTSRGIVNGFKFTPRDQSDQIRKSPQRATIHGSRALVWLLERIIMAGEEDGDGDWWDATIPFKLVEGRGEEGSRCALP